MLEAIYIYVTCSDIKEARKIAGHCVTERIAACGNIYPNIESVPCICALPVSDITKPYLDWIVTETSK
jgi:uncharacterized protein involved in tolerance to divalent cations